MILKLQIDTSQLTSAIAQEVLNGIKPFLLPKEEDADSEQGSRAPETGSGDENTSFPQVGLLRIWQILGNKRKVFFQFIPVSKSTWWAGVKSGKYPKPVKLSARCTCWYVEDIRALLERTGKP